MRVWKPSLTADTLSRVLKKGSLGAPRFAAPNSTAPSCIGRDPTPAYGNPFSAPASLGMLCTRRGVVPKDASVSGDPSYSLAFFANCCGRRDNPTTYAEEVSNGVATS
jgi:hypothetical protein